MLFNVFEISIDNSSLTFYAGSKYDSQVLGYLKTPFMSMIGVIWQP